MEYPKLYQKIDTSNLNQELKTNNKILEKKVKVPNMGYLCPNCISVLIDVDHYKTHIPVCKLTIDNGFGHHPFQWDWETYKILRNDSIIKGFEAIYTYNTSEERIKTLNYLFDFSINKSNANIILSNLYKYVEKSSWYYDFCQRAYKLIKKFDGQCPLYLGNESIPDRVRALILLELDSKNDCHIVKFMRHYFMKNKYKNEGINMFMKFINDYPKIKNNIIDMLKLYYKKWPNTRVKYIDGNYDVNTHYTSDVSIYRFSKDEYTYIPFWPTPLDCLFWAGMKYEFDKNHDNFKHMISIKEQCK